ncbi:MAG: hypothetical protein QW331_02120 [Candidatus Woesearchaeota archaeon]
MPVTLSDNEIKSIENQIRDAINDLTVFQEEYDIPEEAVEDLRSKLENIAKRVGKAM